jgi:hypothetical protein
MVIGIGSIFRMRRKPLVVAMSAALASIASFASDVEVTPAPGGAFIIKDESLNERFRVLDSGEVYIPGVTSTPLNSALLCFSSPTGQVTQCDPSALDGAQGPVGAQGPDGVQGVDGNQGAAGDKGPQGSAGTQGTTGAQGPAGNQGADGNQGAQGDAGGPGAQGTTGDQGPIGNQGADGSQGAQGPDGDTASMNLTEITQICTDQSLAGSGGLLTCQVSCPAGYVVMTGGFECSLTGSSGGAPTEADCDAELFVKQSRPLSLGSGWVATWRNIGTPSISAEVVTYAYCAVIEGCTPANPCTPPPPPPPPS